MPATIDTTLINPHTRLHLDRLLQWRCTQCQQWVGTPTIARTTPQSGTRHLCMWCIGAIARATNGRKP